MTDGVVGEVFVSDDRLECLVKVLEISAEEVGLDLSKLVELDKSVLENSLVLFLHSLSDNTSHKRKELDEVLGVLALSHGQVV